MLLGGGLRFGRGRGRAIDENSHQPAVVVYNNQSIREAVCILVSFYDQINKHGEAASVFPRHGASRKLHTPWLTPASQPARKDFFFVVAVLFICLFIFIKKTKRIRLH